MFGRTRSVSISTSSKFRCAAASPAHSTAAVSSAPSAVETVVVRDLIRAVLRSLRRRRRRQLLQPLAILRVHRFCPAHRGLDRNAVLLGELVKKRILARQVVGK